MTGPPRAGGLMLHLLRHAKSSWDDPGVADVDRPLTPRGERAARKLGRALARERVRPQLVLCSSARRARETLELIRPELPGSPAISLEDGLYAATGRELLARVRRIPPGSEEVLLIGHNPGVHDLALALAGSTAPPSLREQLPTGALISLKVAAARWADVAPGQGAVIRILLPRRL